MRSNILVLGALGFVFACHSAPPPATTASSTQAPHASASSSADAEPSEPTDTTSADATSQAQPDDAAAKAFAKHFAWTKTPSLAAAPASGVFVGVGDEAHVAEVKLKTHKDASRGWGLEIKVPGDADLGPDLSFKGAGAPTVGREYTEAYGPHQDESVFQAPEKGKKFATDFHDTISISEDHAYVVKLTKLSKGKASGRFVIVFDNPSFNADAKGNAPKLWAAGTFTDVAIDAI